MSVATTYTGPTEEAGNDSKVAFDFAFKIFASTDLVVKKKLANATYTAALTLISDYTVSFDSDAETGTVTFAVAPVSGGGGSYISRVTPKTQASVFPREGLMPAKTVEAALDKNTLQIQELAARLTAGSL
ncbi:MAG: hypothetical protein V4510_13510 [bacterium]